jgi:hypothetical protein
MSPLQLRHRKTYALSTDENKAERMESLTATLLETCHAVMAHCVPNTNRSSGITWQETARTCERMDRAPHRAGGLKSTTLVFLANKSF